MALKPLNSVGGFSVGETPSNVIYPNGDFSGNKANFTGNVAALGLLTDNLYYANGTPWDLQEAAGLSTYIQFNDNNNFAASANFTFNSSTNLLTVTGNANVTGKLTVGGVSNLGPIGNVYVTGGTTGQVISTDGAGNLSFVTIDTYQIQNGNSNVVVAANSNVTVAANGINVLTVSGYAGNASNNITNVAGQLGVSGNVTAPNFIGNVVGNISGNIVIPGSNTGVVFNDNGNANSTLGFTFDKTSNAVTANGNLTVNNANLGNLATANFVNVSTNVNVTGTMEAGNVRTDNLLYANGNPWDLQEAAGSNTQIQYNDGANDFGASANLTYDDATQLFTVLGNGQFNNANLGNLAIANFANIASNTLTNNLTVNLELAGNTANFTGNIKTLNANLGNLVTANFANIASNTITNNLSVNLELAGNTANFSGNVVVPNLTVNLELAGNTANFTGNIKTLNANLGNLAIANFVQTGQVFLGNSNVAIAPNANITFSVAGTADVLTVSSVGANIVGYVSANGNGTFGALYSNTLTSQGGNLTLYAATGDNYVELRPTGNGHVDVGNFRIQNLGAPNAASDAATKQYVDDVAQGLNVHDSALAATSNTLANLTGGIITYNNGASGVGANLVLSGSPTANYLSANVFDGNVTAVANSRILVKNEANAAFNGVYVVSNATVLTRATDYDTVPEVEAGDFIFVQDGTTYNDSGWVQTSVVAVMGTDPIVFTQFSGAGTYQAGAGLTLTGTVFSVNVDDTTTEIAGGNVVVKANAQFTTPNIGAATGTSLDLTGNLIAGNVNSNAKVTAANVEVSANIIANNVSANSNITANNATINLSLGGNTANFSGNVVVNNLGVNLELAGNTANFTGNIVALNTNAGNLLTANFANIASNTVTSNLTVNLELAGNTANFTGNIKTLNANLGNLVTANFANIASNTITNNLTVNLELSGNTANFNSATVSGNIAGNNLSSNNVVGVGNTNIGWGTVTTTSISANQTIAQFAVAGVTGAEFIVKGVDSSGSKYSVATVTAVTDGTTTTDYAVYATAQIGSTTGTLVVNKTGSNLLLQVTPSSSNSTVWTAQYRTI